MTAQEWALCVLNDANPAGKVDRVSQFQSNWTSYPKIGDCPANLPNSPARPDRPSLIDPNQVPKRGLGSVRGRAAMLHAIAHIELNAIDLACDMVCRFADDHDIPDNMRAEFVSDWLAVAVDEARHFQMLTKRLSELGFGYGDFPAHNGLWEAAEETRHDLSARLAIAPLVLEARGLDVTPAIIKKLTNVNDADSIAILQVIYREEVSHVAKGVKWFQRISKVRNQPAEAYFKHLVQTHFKGQLKPPFNQVARTLAGMPPEFYTFSDQNAVA